MTSSTRKLILSLSLIGLLAVLGYLSFSILKMREETKDLLMEVSTKMSYDKRAMSVSNVQSELSYDLTVIDEAAITRAELVSLIESLEETGEKLGLSVSVASLTAEDVESSLPEVVKMVVDAEGSWAANFKFLRVLESLPHKSDIESANLSWVRSNTWRSGTTLRVIVFP